MENNSLKLNLQYFAEPGDNSAPPIDPPVDPIPPTEPPVDPLPPTEPPTEPPAPTGKVYTEKEMEDLKAGWLAEQQNQQQQELDFDKMTPEEKAQKLLADQQAENTKLQAQLLDRDLTDYAREQIAKEELPAGSLDFVKGTDKEDTNKRIANFKEILATGIQAGTEKRFKGNGYTPRGTSLGIEKETSKSKQRGVSITTGE